MKVGDGGDVPRVTGHRACKEGAGVVNEVGDDRFHEVLRELGDWGRTCGRCIQGTSAEQPLDSGLAPVPQLICEQLGR
jgi:hypothetical protein